MDFYEYRVSGHYACAIINCDYSGLEDSESEALERWLDSLPSDIKHMDGFSESDSLGFCRCDVTGLLSDCYILRGII